MLSTRGARCTSALAAAVLGVSSLLGGCAGPSLGCCPVGASFEVLEDGAAVTLPHTPERALAAARAVCGEDADILVRLEWSDPTWTTVRIVAPGRKELAIDLVKRIADEADRR